MSRGKEYKGQSVVIEGSRSGAEIPVSRLAYDSAFNLEYSGEAARGSLINAPKWYIEKLSYDSAFNVILAQTASNELYIRPTTVAIDATTNAPLVDITIVGGDLTTINVKDSIRLTTPGNPTGIQGLITSFNSTTGVIQVDVEGKTVVDEGAVAIGINNFVLIMNHPDFKPFNRRVWSLRNLYLYT